MWSWPYWRFATTFSSWKACSFISHDAPVVGKGLFLLLQNLHSAVRAGDAVPQSRPTAG